MKRTEPVNTMLSLPRRGFLKQSALVLAFAFGSGFLRILPAKAKLPEAPLTLLSREHASAIAVLAESMVPGAKASGIVDFIDQQLAAPAEESLMILKYLGVPPSEHVSFYEEGIENVQSLCYRIFDTDVCSISESQIDSLLGKLAIDETHGWTGSPSSLFFFALRSDAVDVVYGTQAGMNRIAMPRMAHLEAGREW